MTIEKLEALANQMSRLACEEMGDLELGEAALFHTACDAIDNLLEALAQKLDDEAERH